jgi:hypothetical protein
VIAEETLLSAARRALRFFRIDEAHGGLTSTDTLIAMDTLDKEIRKEAERQKQAETPQEGEVH